MPAFPKPRPLPPRAITGSDVAAPSSAAGAAAPRVPTDAVTDRPVSSPEQTCVEPVSLEAWFARRGWTPFAFQRQVWSAVARGESGLLHASTGAGKTWAVWCAALQRVQHEAGKIGTAQRRPGRGGTRSDWQGRGLKLLWITPMRALAADTVKALQEPLAELGVDWEVGLRTGDSSSAQRARQERQPPQALVTTPESLSLMLSRADAPQRLGGVQMVVVDEWHELIANKRGVQVQLALARLRSLNPRLITWGLSATLGNLDHAMQVLLARPKGRLVQGKVPKTLRVDTLVPEMTERFPWAGHLGTRLLGPVVARIDASDSTLLFTNTRSQAELWYEALLEARPDWAGLIALHHGSLDASVRGWVEEGLKQGRLKAVVCTSSLDLGVDFSPVQQVLQVGSAKGVARLIQRAGRSGHAPGRPSLITLVPTHALELVEAAAARDAVAAGRIEPRTSPDKPFDVLVQHLVTLAAGTGFEPDALLQEVRSTHAFATLSDAQWAWALDFVTRGGRSLSAYPEYCRVEPDPQGLWRVRDAAIARRHRLSIGTIVADAAMNVQFLGGGRIGSVEESFIARLKRGDCFLFGGRLLELVRVHEMTAWVRRAQGRRAAVPRWNGGRMPLSSEMADAVLDRLDRAAKGQFDGADMQRARPLLLLQQSWSRLPDPRTLVAEHWDSREGHHLFLYPFAGRNVHQGLAALLAWRVSRGSPASFSMAVNDYGLELLSPEAVDWSGLHDGRLLSPEGVLEDVMASLNAGELTLRRFREIARISGLLFQGFPGAAVRTRQLQASAGLFYEVFRQHDADSLLLAQARAEVLEQELQIDRLRDTLQRLASLTLASVRLARPGPFAFPLMVERLREQFSTEKLADRVARMVRELEAAAGESQVHQGLQ